MNSLQAIQLMISPVFMVSGCALLLSTSNNKYSSVMSRIRILSETAKNSKQKTFQIKLLISRLKFIRNATFSFQSAVGFFVLSSLFIGVSHFFKNDVVDSLVIILFSIGMICVLFGTIFLAFESKKGYEIIKEYTKEYL